MPAKTINQNADLRFLPAVDALARTATGTNLREEIGTIAAAELFRAAIADLRRKLLANGNEFHSKDSLLSEAEIFLKERTETARQERFQRVINATGVVIHTNLGRAPLAESARRAIIETAAGYCTLEYDLATGKRGRRGGAAEDLLCEITGAEAAVIVNNCAAAVLLVLTALAAGGESIVSRGELVEIGGDFRVPDVMTQSGTRLVEVGTTNRTKLKDFAAAVTDSTKLFVRVHPSNFRIIGFTEMPELKDLAELARQKNVLLYEDAGSGALLDLSWCGLSDEPIIAESIRAGVDVVTFSGDKLLGGVQTGLIIGKQAVIEKLREHPLYRALRVDKIAYAAVAATLEIYRRETHLREIPVLRMISQTTAEIKNRAEEFVEKSKNLLSANDSAIFTFEFVAGVSAVGGGAAPLANLPTMLIALRHKDLSAAALERRLRFASPPIISRVADNQVLLDLRTVTEAEENEILTALRQIAVAG